MGNYHVRFLGGKEAVIPPTYPVDDIRGNRMSQLYDRSLLEGSLSQMESAAINFALRYINDGKVRMSYINQTRKLAQEYRAKVSSGAITPEEAAKQVQGIRDQILEAQRLRTSDIGKAKAIKLKKRG